MTGEIRALAEAMGDTVEVDLPPGTFLCRGCGADTLQDEYYMVHDAVWTGEAGMASEGGMLCIGCLETRIGRRLVPADFKDAPINTDEDHDWARSDRLLDRLGRGGAGMRPAAASEVAARDVARVVEYLEVAGMTREQVAAWLRRVARDLEKETVQ
jgi:hypothetical protein